MPKKCIYLIAILQDCCKQGYELGFRTFVLQGGEDPVLTDERIESIVSAIHRNYPDCAITLSLGEKPCEAYERFFQAGDRKSTRLNSSHSH